MAKWIVSMLPKHEAYIEPFFGSGAVFFTKPPSRLETINDIDGRVINLFRVMRERPDDLARLIHLTPWARQEYYDAYNLCEDDLESARRFLIRAWMAFGRKTSTATGWRNNLRARFPHYQEWVKLPERILMVSDRLKRVQIECQPAVALLERHRAPHVCIYADPPYVMATKSYKPIYTHEMTDKDHLELLDVLDAHPGPVILSGYDSPLYKKRLSHWDVHAMTVRAELGVQRREMLWLNPVVATQLTQLFWTKSNSTPGA